MAAAAMRRLSRVSEEDEEQVSNGDHKASRAKDWMVAREGVGLKICSTIASSVSRRRVGKTTACIEDSRCLLAIVQRIRFRTGSSSRALGGSDSQGA